MTEIKFCYPSDFLPEFLVRRAFFASWGRIPKPSEVRLENGIISITSDCQGSGTVHIPCPHQNLGIVLESTETLLPRNRPYHLVKELARGSLGKIMRRLYEWQMYGFRPNEDIRSKLKNTVTQFSKMATLSEKSPLLDNTARELIVTLDSIVLQIAEQFTEQSLTWRMRSGTRLPVMLGIGMTDHNAPTSLSEFDSYAHTLQGLFDIVAPTPSWREIEPTQGSFRWDLVEERLNVAARYGFRILAGPLVAFNRQSMPTWLLPRLEEEDFLEYRVMQFVEAFVERFEYIVDRWVVSTSFNSHTLPGVPIFRGFSIIRAAANFIRTHSPDKTIMVGVDQPWGDYGLYYEPQFGLVNIGEALMECKEMDAFLLQLNIGLDEGFSLPRDPMWLGALIDQWSFLGKKVYVSFSVPSSLGSRSGAGTDVISEFWNTKSQAEWVVMVMRMLLSKRSVQGVIWSNLQDPIPSSENTNAIEASPLLPFSGLIDNLHDIKPAYKELQALRDVYVQ